MYIYACIDSTTYVCYAIEQLEEPYDYEFYIPIDVYDPSLITRKKYVNGEWVDTVPSEAENANARTIGVNGEWLDDKIVSLEEAIDNHIHDGYASADDFELLKDVINTKADITHSHDNYSLSNHEHDDYAMSSHSHSDYSPISHSHSIYASVASLNDLSATVSNKADFSHSHNDIYYTESEIDTKLDTKSDVSHNHDSVYDAIGSATNALVSANAYTDYEIDVLSETVATKVNATDLTSHTGNTTVHIASTERTNWNAAKIHADSVHAPSNAEENQNAFSNIVVNGTTISADNKTDTLTIVAGNNVTITPDSTGDAITISSANTVYSHPTSAGNKHIPSGGSSGQILRWSADGTAVWGNDNNTTYSNATQTTSGLMSDTDKTKLDGIAVGANNYTLPSAGTDLGGVKTGGDVTISSGVITVNDDSHNHVISNVDGLQSALDAKAASGHNHDNVYYTEAEVDTLLSGKAATSHGTHVTYSTTAPVMDGTASVGTASTVARSDHKHPVDTSRAAQTSLDSHTSNKSNPHGVTLAQLGVTATASELNYVDGVTSNIQTQLDSKMTNNIFAGSGTSGVSGYIAFAQLVVTGNYVNRPIEFELICRGKDTPCYVNVVFSNSSSTDPVLSKLSYFGTNYGVFIHKVDTSTWLLYHTKSESYDNLTVARVQVASQGIAITYPGSFITEKPTENVTDAVLGGNVAYAEKSGNASTLNGYSVVTAGTKDTWGKIPVIGAGDGVLEVGKYIDFHTTDGNEADYDVRITASTSGLTLSGTTTGTFSGSLSGNASTATKLTSSAGSATQPVYFSDGKPVACTYTLGKSVPSDAVFTDTNTTYSAGTGISLSGTTFSNSGVRSISTGSSNGTISVNTNGTSANVSVKGLGSAAYTASSAYLGSSGDQTLTNGSFIIPDASTSCSYRATRTVDSVVSQADLYISENGNPRLRFNSGGSTVNYLSLQNDSTILGKPLAIGSGGTGATTAANARSNLGIDCTSLYSGSLSSGSCTFTYGSHKAYVVIGKPSSSSYGIVSLFIPASYITSSKTMQLTDNLYYMLFDISGSGTTGKITVGTNNNSGTIMKVYGVN